MSDLVSTGGGKNHSAGCGCPWCTSTAHDEAEVNLDPGGVTDEIDQALGDAIEWALGDETTDVRAAAARNPCATPAQIDQALGDESWRVRVAADENPSASEAQIDRVLGDEEKWVRIDAKRNRARRR